MKRGQGQELIVQENPISPKNLTELVLLCEKNHLNSHFETVEQSRLGVSNGKLLFYILLTIIIRHSL